MDIILTTNSPGEVIGWVKPFLYYASRRFPESKITVFITPCPFGTGMEREIVKELPGVYEAYSPKEYLSYILLKREPPGFTPPKEGFVLFLGGDLTYAVLLGKRLKLPIFAYTEGHRNWSRSISLFFLPVIKERRREIRGDQWRVVGNPMLDAVDIALKEEPPLFFEDKVLALFPGSRKREVLFMVPYFHSCLKELREDVRVVISRSPFVEEGLIESILEDLGEISWEVLSTGRYSLMKEASLALTIPGTSTLELAYLRCPTIVVLPLDRPGGIPLKGLPGLIGSIPLLGKIIKRWFIPYMMKKIEYVALPNIFVGEEIFKELTGILDKEEVLSQVETLLYNKQEIDWKRVEEVLGRGGAIETMLEEIVEYLNL